MILNHLHFWHDLTPREAPHQMAVDEAALQSSLTDGDAILRFYEWNKPAVTIGYFDRFPDDESREVVRRMTGGGLVEHGDDVTFCLTLPPGCEASKASTEIRYRWIHEALFDALVPLGIDLTFGDGIQTPNGPCFTNPVKWDLLDSTGQKVVGGAQRKSKGGVIHQGSICLNQDDAQSTDKHDWPRVFAKGLAEEVSCVSECCTAKLELMADFLSQKKYASRKWNESREINIR